MPTKFKVKIEGSYEQGFGYYEVKQDGVTVAKITGSGGMYYIQAATEKREFMGRFKYSRSLACAKDFAKWLLSRFTVAEYLVGLSKKDAQGRDMAPLTFLELNGYVHPNVRRAEKRAAIRAYLAPSRKSMAI